MNIVQVRASLSILQKKFLIYVLISEILFVYDYSMEPLLLNRPYISLSLYVQRPHCCILTFYKPTRASHEMIKEALINFKRGFVSIRSTV